MKAGRADAIQEGRWRLAVTTVDDQGQASSDRQAFTVNTTLGYVTTRFPYRRFVVRPGGTQTMTLGATLARPARVTVAVESVAGIRVRLLSQKLRPAGRFELRWDGRTLGGKGWAYTSTYVVRLTAKNDLGTVELTRSFGVLRAAPVKKPKPTLKQPG